MSVTRRAVLRTLGGGAVVTGLAGCTENTTGGDSPMGTDSTATAESPTPGTPTVYLRKVGSRKVLTTAEGMTLYMFDKDTQGANTSACTGGCRSNWPPLVVDGEPVADDGVTATLTTFQRDDGSMQVAANGWPLYSFAPDTKPGDFMGQGVGGVWWMLDPAGEPVRDDDEAPTVGVATHPDLGDILVDAEGMTLYMFDKDTQGSDASTCTGGCLENWPALVADGDATASADVTATLTTFERDDGSTQVAANGWPLYSFTSDKAPGDAKGQAVGDVWWVLRPDGTPYRGSETETATS